jgi:tRNA G10  N-methylase Trm11
MPETVQSVVRCATNGPLIAAAAQLWIGPDDLVLDATYGRGNFWTKIRPARLVAHDLALDGVDFRQLPEGDASVDVVVFDPPYIAQGGRQSSTTPDFLDRYGLVDVPKTVSGLNELVAAGIKEALRVLKPKGRLMVKCMDYINGGKLILGRHHVVTTALALGMEQVDEFIHYSGTGPQPPRERQLHSRHAHNFLCVFQAPAKHGAESRTFLKSTP